MKTSTVIGVAIAGALAIGLFGTYISYSNLGNRTEVAISAKYADNENVYAQGTQAVIEIAQVPEMYVADLKQIVTAAIQGRYGENGSQATFQWLKEQNPQLDPSMYTRIQDTILAFRGRFETAQRELLDQCRSYETLRGNFWSGKWLSIAGYPQRDMSKMCTIVSTTKARQTFETKTDTGIQLRKSN